MGALAARPDANTTELSQKLASPNTQSRPSLPQQTGHQQARHLDRAPVINRSTKHVQRLHLTALLARAERSRGSSPSLPTSSITSERQRPLLPCSSFSDGISPLATILRRQFDPHGARRPEPAWKLGRDDGVGEWESALQGPHYRSSKQCLANKTSALHRWVQPRRSRTFSACYSIRLWESASPPAQSLSQRRRRYSPAHAPVPAPTPGARPSGPRQKP